MSNEATPLTGAQLGLRGIIQNEIYHWREIEDDGTPSDDDAEILRLAEHLARVLIPDILGDHHIGA